VTASAPRFYAEPTVEDEGIVTAHAVVDGSNGERIAYLRSASDALQLAALLDALSSGSWPEDVLLGNGEHRRLLRRIELRHPAVCFRCGHGMPAGSPAFWHPVSKVVRHVGSCKRAQLLSLTEWNRQLANAHRRERRRRYSGAAK
jgi:hypothetical protein